MSHEAPKDSSTPPRPPQEIGRQTDQAEAQPAMPQPPLPPPLANPESAEYARLAQARMQEDASAERLDLTPHDAPLPPPPPAPNAPGSEPLFIPGDRVWIFVALLVLVFMLIVRAIMSATGVQQS